MATSKKNYGDCDETIPVHQTHLERLVAYYAKTASEYNKWHNNPTNHSSHNYATRETLFIMKKLGARSLLDVCCGTGRGIKAALDAGYDARGIDISKELIRIGSTELGIPLDRFDIGDAAKLPYEDNSFDVACIFGALHHTAVPRQIVSEMLRVARHAIVISDEANHLSGGIKEVLIRLHLFEPIYRLIFRRAPRVGRRQGLSDTDGPTFIFSIEEVIPLVRLRHSHFKCLTFYRWGRFQVCSYRLPRLFARQGVLTAWTE